MALCIMASIKHSRDAGTTNMPVYCETTVLIFYGKIGGTKLSL